MIIYTIHRPHADHLAEVVNEMETLGSPTIRVVDCRDYLVAIEGCHRIEAARILRIPVVLDILNQDELVDADSLDIDYFVPGEAYTAGEIAGECYHSGSGCYEIDDDGTVELVFEAPNEAK